jgi:transporter family protein
MHVAPWFWFVVIVLVAWGVVGIFQKLSTNYISAESTLVWLMVGLLLFEPFVYPGKQLLHYCRHSLAYGLLSGLLSMLGAWGLFAAMKYGGKASIVTPISALYPLVVVVLSPFVLHESVTGLEGLGVLCALIAVSLLSTS